MYIKEIGSQSLEWIHTAQGVIFQWRDFMNNVKNLRVIEDEEFHELRSSGTVLREVGWLLACLLGSFVA
jgi:hypothetical protein